MTDLGSKVSKAQFRSWYMEERAKREAIEKTVGDLKDALGKYGRHLRGCHREDMLPCNCGFYRSLESFTVDGETNAIPK